MEKLLPIWIIGAPLAYLFFDWMRTPKTSIHSSHQTTYTTTKPIAQVPEQR